MSQASFAIWVPEIPIAKPTSEGHRQRRVRVRVRVRFRIRAARG